MRRLPRSVFRRVFSVGGGGAWHRPLRFRAPSLGQQAVTLSTLAVQYQKVNRAESCRMRGPRSPMTCPNVELAVGSPVPHVGALVGPQLLLVSKRAVVSTSSNDTWLKALYASRRTENPIRSRIGMFFCNAISQLFVPGPRNNTFPVMPAISGPGMTPTGGSANMFLSMNSNVL